jgi:hypothetical protein
MKVNDQREQRYRMMIERGLSYSHNLSKKAKLMHKQKRRKYFQAVLQSIMKSGKMGGH